MLLEPFGVGYLQSSLAASGWTCAGRIAPPRNVALEQAIASMFAVFSIIYNGLDATDKFSQKFWLNRSQSLSTQQRQRNEMPFGFATKIGKTKTISHGASQYRVPLRSPVRVRAPLATRSPRSRRAVAAAAPVIEI